MTVLEKATSQEAEAKDWSTPVKLVIVFAALAILPSLLVMMTSFTRIVIVLAFVRRALSTQSIPPTVAMIGLALFLTLYTMAPTYALVNARAIQPYLADEIGFADAAQKAGDCIKEFMLRQSRKADLALFVQMAKIPPPEAPMDLALHIVVPTFIVSPSSSSSSFSWMGGGCWPRVSVSGSDDGGAYRDVDFSLDREDWTQWIAASPCT